jgi:hypothetical protein
VTGFVAVGCDHTRILGPNVALLKGRQVTAVQEHGVAGAEDLLLQRGAYLASTEGIRCESRSEGLKGLFAQGLGDAENCRPIIRPDIPNQPKSACDALPLDCGVSRKFAEVTSHLGHRIPA